MKNLLCTFGSTFLNAIAVQVAGFSGLIAFAVLLYMTFMKEGRTFGALIFFAFFAGVCYLGIRILKRSTKRAQGLIQKINSEHGLAFDPANILGYPTPVIAVFDKQNRKFAICNTLTGDYRVHDIAHLLNWCYEWGTGVRTDIGITGGAFVPGTTMREPTTAQSEYKKNFVIALEVADMNQPILKFPVPSEAAAKQWDARLNALFNG